MHPLAEQRPAWCAELAARWLDRKVAMAKAAPPVPGRDRLSLNDDFGVDDLFKSAEGDPEAFLENVLPSVIRAINAFVHAENEGFPRDPLWPFWIRSPYISMLEAFPGACENAFRHLGKNTPQHLRRFIDQLRMHRSYTANHLLMTLYANGSAALADEVLELLADEPERLQCGYSDSPFWIARQIIEKFTPFCSDKVYQKLEAVVLNFTSPYERSANGFRSRGNSAFNLATSLANSKLSAAAKTQIAEWTEKFKQPDGPPVGVRSFTVSSPIEEEAAEHMTDEHWLRAIAKYATEEREPSFEHPERGGALELARMLQKFTEKEPLRFSELALQIPDNSHPYYLSHVLRGLKESTIPFASKLSVARRVFNIDQHDCWQASLAVLSTAKFVELSSDAIHYIQKAAANLDPQTELWPTEKGYYGGDILTHGINTVRGCAAETIRDLIFTDERFLPSFASTIDALVADPSLAVRACVASVLLAVVNHDIPLAIQWSKTLFEADDRLLGTPYAQRFVHDALRSNVEPFTSTIERMLKSSHVKVRESGGTIACLARLYHESVDSLSEMALTGDVQCRLGACEVAKSNLLQSGCRLWCEDALVRLFADESPEVRRKAAGCFWHLWHSPETPLTKFDDLIKKFLASPAFTDEPSFLLHALEETKHKVPDATLDVCEIFIARCGEEARDIRTSIAGDEMTVGKLVFTAYAQLDSPHLQARTLDIIDQMSLEGLNSANTHLAEFER